MKKIIVASFIDQEINSAVFAGSDTVYITEKELKAEDLPNFLIVNNLAKLEELRAKYDALNHPVKFIFIGRNNKVQDFYYLHGAIIIDPFWMQNPLGSALIKRSIEDQPSIHLQEIFNNSFDKYYSYKIQNIFRLGYYADILCKDAIDQKMNFVSIRSFFDHAVLYCSYLKELSMAEFPCEFEYAYKDGHLTMMIHLATSKMTQDYLVEAMGEDNTRNPMSSLLRTCLRSCDYFDVMYYQKGKRLTLVGVWVTDEKRKEIAGPTVSLNIIQQKNEKTKTTENYEYDYDHQVDPAELEKLDESKELPKLPGTHVALADIPEDSAFKKDQALMQELAYFVKEKVAMDNPEIKDSDLTAKEIGKILESYSDQELIKKINENDLQIIANVIASGKHAEDFINLAQNKENSAAQALTDQIAQGQKIFKEEPAVKNDFVPDWKKDLESKVEISTPEAKAELATDMTQALLENVMGATDYKKLLENPNLLITSDIIKQGDNEIKMSDSLKAAITGSWKEKMDQALKGMDVSSISEEKMQTMMMQQLEAAVSNVMVESDADVAKVAGVAYKAPEDSYRMSMQNIEKELVTKFSSNDTSPEDQANIILNTVQNAVKDMPMVIKGDKNQEEATMEIINRMGISDDHKKLLQSKIKSNAENNDDNDVAVISGGAEIESSEYTVTPSSGGKNKKTPNYSLPKQVVTDDTEDNQDDDVTIISGGTEFESNEYKVRPSSGVKPKKPKKLDLPKQVIPDNTEEEEEPIAIVSGSDEIESNEYKVRPSSGVKPKKPKKLDLPKQVIPDNSEVEEEPIAVISGNAEIEANEYKVRPSSGVKPKKPKKLDLPKQVVSDNSEEEEEPIAIISGNAEFKGSEYKVRQGSGQLDPGGEFKVADNSQLLKKIQDLEEQLKLEKQKKYEREATAQKEKNEQIAAAQKDEVVDNEKFNETTKDIEKNNALSESQKNQLLEMIKKEKESTLKYKELQDAFHKTKAILDGQNGQQSQELDALERTARHRELQVEQIKTKMDNLQRVHDAELKRVTFDINKQTQRAVAAQTDQIKKKLATLEREKNTIKTMFDEFKARVAQEKDAKDNDYKIAPKVAEADAQKRRAEVKLAAKELEAQDLKKMVEVKDRALQQFSDQKSKLEEELGKWKKEALTKRSEAPKPEPTPVQGVEGKPILAPVKAEKPAEIKHFEDKISSLKEEMLKEKSHFNKELNKEREHAEEMKRSYLTESNKVKSLEIKYKEITEKMQQLQADLAAQTAAKAAENSAAGLKDTSGLSTKYRILEETQKKITKDFSDTKVKLEESKKEIAMLTKKSNETQFKLQEKEKLAEKLQAELKALKETPVKKTA